MSIRVNEISNLKQYQCTQQKIAFRGEEQAPVDTEQKPDTFEKEGMSTGKKVAIGIGSLVGLIAAGFSIKKCIDIKAANKALKEAAAAVGIDVKAYKDIQECFGEIKTFEELHYEDIWNWAKGLYKEGKVKEGYSLGILQADKLAAVHKQVGNNPSDIPKNAIYYCIVDKDKIIAQQVAVPKKIGQDLIDLLPKDAMEPYTQKFVK